MDILPKLQDVADALERYDWSDMKFNKNIFPLWQTFLESMYSSNLRKPVQVASIELRIGSDEEFEHKTLESFGEFQLKEEWSSTETPHFSYERLKEQLKSVSSGQEIQNVAGEPSKQDVKSNLVAIKRITKRKKTSRREVVNEQEDSKVSPRKKVASVTAKAQKDTESCVQEGAQESLETDCGPTKAYGTRRIRKRKRHFNEDDFVINWPTATKKSFSDDDSAKDEDYHPESDSVNDPGLSYSFACAECADQRFESQEDVNNHLQSVHKTFDADDSLESAKKGATAVCLHCDESTLKSEKTLREHIRENHMKRKKTLVSVSCIRCPLMIHGESKGTGRLKVLVDVLLDHILESHKLSNDMKVKCSENLKESSKEGVLDVSVELDDDVEIATSEETKNEVEGDDTSRPSPRKKAKKTSRRKACLEEKECPTCGVHFKRGSYYAHMAACKKHISIEKKGDLKQLPDDLPLTSCPLCEKEPPKFDKLQDWLGHIRKEHYKDDLTCPICDLKWTKNKVKGKIEMQCQNAFASKVFMHFVLSHDHLVQDKATESEKVDSSVHDAGSALNEGERDALTNKQTTSATEDTPEAQSVSEIVTSLANNQIVEVAQTVVTAGESTSVATVIPEDVNGQISFIDSDTLASVTAVNNLLAGQQDLNESGFTVQLFNEGLMGTHQDGTSQNVQYVQYVHADGTQELTQVVYQTVEEVSAENSAVLANDSDANVDFSKLQDPFPNEPIITCSICTERPRYTRKKAFDQHINDMHVEKSKNNDGEDVMSLSCWDCSEVVFTGVVHAKHGGVDQMVACLSMHQMFRHFQPRPLHLKVIRCEQCQYETLNYRNYMLHLRGSRDCGSAKQDESEESDEREFQCVLCHLQDKTKPWEKLVSERAYTDHMKENHIQVNGNNIAAQCSICNKSYNSVEGSKASVVRRVITYFTNHMVQAHDAQVPVQDEMIQCPLCPTLVTLGKMYEYHVARKHRLFREKVLKKSDEVICESCAGLMKKEHFPTHQEICGKIQKTPKGRDKVICEICGMSVTYDHYVYTHRDACAGKNRDEEKTFHCDQCKKAYHTKSQLLDHINMSHKRRETYKCQICDESMAGQRAFQEHMMALHEINVGGQPLKKCPVCDYRGLGKTVRLHCKEIHNLTYSPNKRKSSQKPTWYICEQCNYRTQKEHSFKSHLAHRHNINRYNCELCRYIGKSKTAFEKHMSTVHPSGETHVHFCDICQKQYSSTTCFDNHMFVKHGVNQTNRPVLHCEKCGFRTLGQALLNNHMKSHDCKVFSCEFCGKQFNTRGSLMSHRRRHVKQYRCGQCHLACGDRSQLDRHIARVHTELIFKCDFCRYTAFTERLYRIHLQVNHQCSADLAQTLIENAKTQSNCRKSSRAAANRKSAHVVISNDDDGDSFAAV